MLSVRHDHSQSRRQRFLRLRLFSVGVLLATVVLTFVALREPAYAGKNLSQWVEAYVTSQGNDIPAPRPSPAEAIGHIGVDAIPYLLKWICYETPPWKREFYRAI